jgi:cell division protein FtsQ
MTLRGGGGAGRTPDGGLDAPRPGSGPGSGSGPQPSAEPGASRPGGAAGGAASRPGGVAGGAARPGGAGGGGRPPGPLARRGAVPWRAVAVAGVALVIVLGIAWALLGSSVLVVRHIKVTGNGRIPAGKIRAASGIKSGTPLLRLDSAAASRRVERINQVLSAKVSRSLPDTVVISIRVRAPSLVVADAGAFELVDGDGVVLRTRSARPAGLPLLRQPPPVLRGNPAVHAAARVLAELPAQVRGQVLAVTATSADAVTLHLRGRITIRWGGPDRAAAKARELRALLRTHARYYDVSSPTEAVTAG